MTKDEEKLSEVTVDGFRLSLVNCHGVAPFTDFSQLLATGVGFLARRGAWRTAIDFASGSGIQAFLLSRWGVHQVYAIEQDEAAAYALLTNSKRNGVCATLFPQVPERGISVVIGSSFSALGETQVDLIVSNPPTMPACRSLPSWANGGGDGREVLATLISDGPAHLGPDGELVVVHSSLAGLQLTTQLLATRGFVAERIVEVLLPFREWYQVCLPKFRELSRYYDVNWIESPSHELFELVSVVRFARAKVEQLMWPEGSYGS